IGIVTREGQSAADRRRHVVDGERAGHQIRYDRASTLLEIQCTDMQSVAVGVPADLEGHTRSRKSDGADLINDVHPSNVAIKGMIDVETAGAASNRGDVQLRIGQVESAVVSQRESAAAQGDRGCRVPDLIEGADRQRALVDEDRAAAEVIAGKQPQLTD